MYSCWTTPLVNKRLLRLQPKSVTQSYVLCLLQLHNWRHLNLTAQDNRAIATTITQTHPYRSSTAHPASTTNTQPFMDHSAQHMNVRSRSRGRGHEGCMYGKDKFERHEIPAPGGFIGRCTSSSRGGWTNFDGNSGDGAAVSIHKNEHFPALGGNHAAPAISSSVEDSLATITDFKIDINKRDGQNLGFSEFAGDKYVCDFLASPMVNVCSVTIHSSYDGEPCKIYGEIYFEGEEGGIHKLYEREQNQAETILSGGGTLLVTGPMGGLVTMAAPVIFIKLKDEAHGDDWFSDGQLELDTMTEGSNAKCKSAIYHGDRGKVIVDYIAMPCAVVANVKVEISDVKFHHSKKGAGFIVDSALYGGVEGAKIDVDADVNGTIVARYGKTTGCKIDDYRNVLFSMLNEPGRMAFGCPIRLSRSLVCVPADSSLIMDVSLTLNSGTCEEFKVCQLAEFRPFDDCLAKETNGNVRIETRVEWIHPYELFPYKSFDISPSKETEDIEKDPRLFFWQSHSDQQAPAKSISSIPSVDAEIFAFFVAEVYSVLVGHDSDEAISLYGTTRFEDLPGLSYGFRRDKSHPEILRQPSKPVPLDGILSFSKLPVCVCLNLKDVEGHVDIKGYLDLNHHLHDGFLNKPLCSFIRGDRGYAAVHYKIFSKAVQAAVKAFVVFKDPVVATNVYGRLVGRYGDLHDWTPYEAQYYQSVLFEKPEDEMEQQQQQQQQQPNGHCKPFKAFLIPLRRSVVSIPLTGCLNIEVDLQVCYSQSSGKVKAKVGECLRGNAAIKIGNDGKYQNIEGHGCHIGFSVEWLDCLGDYFLGDYEHFSFASSFGAGLFGSPCRFWWSNNTDLWLFASVLSKMISARLLQPWQGLFLSQAGRLALISSVLSAML